MRISSRAQACRTALSALAFLAGLAMFPTGPLAASDPAPESPKPQTAELRGRVVCLPERMHQLYQVELPEGHEHLYGFESRDGSFYTLLRTKFSEALFADSRLRQKDLLLKGRILPKTHLFDVERMRSVRNGIVNDLYYYCSVCNIESVSPGPCACCQGTVELVEKPLRHPE